MAAPPGFLADSDEVRDVKRIMYISHVVLVSPAADTVQHHPGHGPHPVN